MLLGRNFRGACLLDGRVINIISSDLSQLICLFVEHIWSKTLLFLLFFTFTPIHLIHCIQLGSGSTVSLAGHKPCSEPRPPNRRITLVVFSTTGSESELIQFVWYTIYSVSPKKHPRHFQLYHENQLSNFNNFWHKYS